MRTTRTSWMRQLAIAAVSAGVATALHAEDLTITTYYPSPRGVYDELQTMGNTYLAVQGGNVGIGTANPGAKLEVVGEATTNANNLLVLENPNNDAAAVFFDAQNRDWALGASNSGSGLGDERFILFDATASAARLVVDQAGNVGIGTNSPTATLEVGGQLKITGGGPGPNEVLASDASGLGTWKTLAELGAITGSGTVNMVPKWTAPTNLGDSTIFDNGNVGVGNLAPTEKLDVAGNIRIGDSNALFVGADDGASGTFIAGVFCDPMDLNQKQRVLTIKGGVVTDIAEVIVGSCLSGGTTPFLASWDGQRYVVDNDILMGFPTSFRPEYEAAKAMYEDGATPS